MLTCLITFCLFIFTRAGFNREWFGKVTGYWDDYREQRRSDASIEQIKEERWGASYKISKMVQKQMKDKHIENPVILLEPNAYLEKTAGFQMPEPIVFYYFTGIKALWTNSPNVKDATHILRIQKGRMLIDTISSPEALQQILTFYKPYPTAL